MVAPGMVVVPGGGAGGGSGGAEVRAVDGGSDAKRDCLAAAAVLRYAADGADGAGGDAATDAGMRASWDGVAWAGRGGSGEVAREGRGGRGEGLTVGAAGKGGGGGSFDRTAGGGWGDPAANVTGADAVACDLERRGGAHGRAARRLLAEGRLLAAGAYTPPLLSAT